MSIIKRLFHSGGTVNCPTYITVGFFLFAIKYNIDRAVALLGYNIHDWYLNDYLNWYGHFVSLCG